MKKLDNNQHKEITHEFPSDPTNLSQSIVNDENTTQQRAIDGEHNSCSLKKAFKNLFTRVASQIVPTWLQCGYELGWEHLGFRNGNFLRTNYLISCLMFECAKNYFRYMSFAEYLKEIERTINNKPINNDDFDINAAKFILSLSLFVASSALSDSFLEKFKNSLTTALKIKLTELWIKSGAYNGIHYLQLKENEKIHPSLVLTNDVSEFVTTTANLIDNLGSIVAAAATAIPVFLEICTAETLLICFTLTTIIKAISYFSAQKLRANNQQLKYIEEKQNTEIHDVNKFSESVELCGGAAFEVKSITECIQEAFIITNLTIHVAGLIKFCSELFAYASYGIGIILCRTALLNGTIGITVARNIGYALSDLLELLIWIDSKSKEYVIVETTFNRIKLLLNLIDQWLEALKNRKFTITQTDDIFQFYGTIKDPSGKILLSESTISLDKGKRYQITGPSGSGKSTIIRALYGMWPYVEGDLKIPRNTVVLPQLSHIRGSNSTLLDIIRYPKTEKATADEIVEIKRLMQVFNLQDKIDKLELSSWEIKNKNGKSIKVQANWFKTLSGGEKQRISLIYALIKKPKLLILDEAISAIDPDNRKIVEEELKKLSDTIILFVDHNSSPSESDSKLLPSESEINIVELMS